MFVQREGHFIDDFEFPFDVINDNIVYFPCFKFQSLCSLIYIIIK